MERLVEIDKKGWEPHQLRIWSYLNHRQDIFWPIDQWPSWAQRQIVLTHKSDSAMFNLAVFFLVNGLPEEVAFDWIRCRDVRGTQLVEGNYSLKEYADMERLRWRWGRGLLPLRGKRVYDMNLRRPVDAGEYKQGNDRGAEGDGNRITTNVISLGGDDPAPSVYPKETRYDSDDWLG